MTLNERACKKTSFIYGIWIEELLGWPNLIVAVHQENYRITISFWRKDVI